jgi:uncharacterized protein (TIGR02679 family)
VTREDDLRAAFDRPELTELWRLARETAESPRPRSAFSIQVPDEATATALGGVLRKHVDHPARRQISLVRLNEHLLASPLRCGLVEVLEAVHHRPVEPRAAERAVSTQRRDPAETSLWRALSEHGLDGRPWASRWVEDVRRYGKVPTDQLPVLARRAAEVLSRMVLTGTPVEWTARHELAARHGGGAHELDHGKVLSRVVLRGAALARGVEVPKYPAQQVQLWESCGVAVDSVSAAVLTWALPLRGDTSLAREVRDRSARGRPVHLTLMDLWDGVLLTPGTVIFVCASPRVVEQAITSGSTGPLVCLSGGLNATARQLLVRLTEAGAEVRCHAGFTPEGMALASQVLELTGGRPWRMSSSDYRDAVAALLTEGVELRSLTTAPDETSWDPQLCEVMATTGLQVEEEQLLPSLLADLTCGPRS